MLSGNRIFGLICTLATCDHIFPPPIVPKITSTSEASPLVVDTNCGQVEGYYSNSLNGKLFRTFEGIPYAEPPIRDRRFREPSPKQRWKGILKANKKITCMQMDPLRYYNVIGQEDCLYLNIYTPENRGNLDKLPVLFWIHGGSFFWGAGHLFGPTYLMDQNIILVTINYRLGPLGFLSTGDEASYGNWALKDQNLALDWVHQNIENFGGDSSRITMAGHSSGGASTHLHMMSPLSTGKFIGAISQSASALSFWALPPRQVQLTKKLAENVGCKSANNNNNMMQCLRRKNAKRLVSTQYNLFEWLENPPILFGPVVEPSHDKAFITSTPEELYAQGQVANIPWITGVTKDEGDLFTLVNYLTPLGTRNLLRNFKKAIPAVLMTNRTDTVLTNQIHSFYLSKFKPGSFSLSGFEALKCLSNMVGDRYFYIPFHKTLRKHSESIQSPLYGYIFTYKGRHSFTEKGFVSPKEWGVMHMDEVQYLFNSTDFFAPIAVSDREFILSDYLIKLWTSFVETGKPIISPSPHRLTAKEWIPYNNQNEQRQLLEINFDSKMRKEVYEDRVQFWKNISLY